MPTTHEIIINRIINQCVALETTYILALKLDFSINKNGLYLLIDNPKPRQMLLQKYKYTLIDTCENVDFAKMQ